jgi:hypothetical protein
MEWHFTVKNGDQNGAYDVGGVLYLEDPSGKQFSAGRPGTFTEGQPINAGQTFHEYTTFAFLPTSGVTYTLHLTMNPASEGYQSEMFTF